MRCAWLVALLTGYVIANAPNQDGFGPYGEDCLAEKTFLYDPSIFQKTSWYTIDLDLPPEQRWAQIAASYGAKMQKAIDVVKFMAEVVLGEGTWDIMMVLMKDAPDKLREPYRSEIKAMSEMAGVDLSELTLLNIFYEISKACTSVVAQDNNGRMYHGRNLDFGFMFNWNKTAHSWDLTDTLKDLVVNLQFVKGGKLLFKGVTYAGHLGVLTGVRPNAFSVSINTRLGSGNTDWPLLDFFFHGLGDEEFLVYAMRDMLTNYDNFDEAVNYMENVPMMTGGYLIMSGPKPGQGVIITRSANGTDHEAKVDVTKPDQWYVLQTNYDWNKDVIFLDDRRGPGNDCMKRLGQNRVDLAGIYQVLSSKPTLNKATTYTALMQVNDGILQTITRTCDDPCWFV